MFPKLLCDSYSQLSITQGQTTSIRCFLSYCVTVIQTVTASCLLLIKLLSKGCHLTSLRKDSCASLSNSSNCFMTMTSPVTRCTTFKQTLLSHVTRLCDSSDVSQLYVTVQMYHRLYVTVQMCHNSM